MPSVEECDHQIGELQQEWLKLGERITELRRQRPAEPVRDYTLRRSDGSDVKLSELFGDKSDLLVIHNMGRSCPYCTLWADGFNGVAKHLQNRAGFAVISPDDPETQARFAADRGWTFPLCSAQGTTFIEDMGYLKEEGYWPGVSAFRKNEDGSIVRVARDYLGPGDAYCSVWHLFDLLPDGPNGWEPKYSY